MTTTTKTDWLALVLKAEPDHNYKANWPVVYKFSNGREFKEHTPESGAYKQD